MATVVESAQALRAYTDYQAQTPPRSLDRLAQTYQSAPEPRPPTTRIATLKEWSSSFNWQERVRAHDEAIAAEAAARDKAARLAELDKRRQDRIKVAAAVRGKAIAALSYMKPKILAERPDRVTRMFMYSDQTERLDMGEATERIDVTRLTDQELDAIIAGHPVGGTRTATTAGRGGDA